MSSSCGYRLMRGRTHLAAIIRGTDTVASVPAADCVRCIHITSAVRGHDRPFP